MANLRAESFLPENAPRVFGEIYEYQGGYWAEVIVAEDGFETVTEKSAEFVNRAQAEAWLARRKVAVELTGTEAVLAAIANSPVVSFLRKLLGANPVPATV